MTSKQKLYSNTKPNENVQKPTTFEGKMEDNKKKLDTQDNMLSDALASINESNNIATQTLAETKKNNESIDRSINLTKDVTSNANSANKSLGRIERRRKYFGFFDMFNFN